IVNSGQLSCLQMWEKPAHYDDANCSMPECLNVRALLRWVGCTPERPRPGQRVLLPPSSLPPILRGGGARYPARRVQFALPQPLDDANSEATVSPDGSMYDGKDSASFTTDSSDDGDGLRCRVQLIPADCLRELRALGALERILVAHERKVGRLAIDSFLPFRSLYFYATVIYHLSANDPVPIDRVAVVCAAVAELNNSIVVRGAASHRDIPGLLAYLSPGAGSSDSLAASDSQRKCEWRDVDRKRMRYSIDAGRSIADMDTPEMQQLLGQLVRQRRVIRPVFDYMYHEYARTGSTDGLVCDGALQFQVYAWVREAMEGTCANPPLSYVVYVALFAIGEINDRVAQAVAETLPDGAPLGLRPTVAAAGGDDDVTVSGAKQHPAATGPLAPKELLCLLDWDFAATLGYLLAHRFHEMDPSATAGRARVNALALSVDLTQSQPFPPIAPSMDGRLHTFVSGHVNSVYESWPDGFVDMVIDETVVAYNDLILDICSSSNSSSSNGH
ncbi:hypothetical protein H4R19_003164, partial [Coemansia spiralis]